MTEQTALEKLQQRVHDGIVWLDSHDPKGIFHLWFTAGLTPISPMPAHPDGEVRERYREYHGARMTFERLDRELARLEKRGPTPLGDPAMQWSPAR